MALTLKVGPQLVAHWTLADFRALPQSEQVVDIHCVTTWSKFDTRWRGVTVDDLLAAVGVHSPPHGCLPTRRTATAPTLPLADLTQGRAMVATHFDDKPLTHEHGGLARLLVPHLYFWNRPWLSSLQFTSKEEPGSGKCAATTCAVTRSRKSAMAELVDSANEPLIWHEAQVNLAVRRNA